MKEAFPIVEVGDRHHQFDLHNDGDLRGVIGLASASFLWIDD